jgi:hypothetical protein
MCQSLIFQRLCAGSFGKNAMPSRQVAQVSLEFHLTAVILKYAQHRGFAVFVKGGQISVS